MKKVHRIAISEMLNGTCDINNEAIQMQILERVKQYADMFEKHIVKDNNGVVGGVMELLDVAIAESARKNSCKRGCHFCCKINVDISEEEASLIAYYCKVNNIKVDKNYLKQQLAIRKLDIPLSKVCDCVFLKNGECSIYEARPLMCRKYMVASPPEQCDYPNYPPPFKGVAIVNDIETEIVYSAFLNACRKYPPDRMPRQLLKFIN